MDLKENMIATKRKDATMKKLLVVAALTMAAAPAAMASKARVEALGNSRQIVDFQTAFDRPYEFLQVGELATIEWGTDGQGAGDRHAEGGFLKKAGDSAYGLYFGRRSDEFGLAVRESATPANYLLEQNALNLIYATKMGEMTIGGTLKYSAGKDETAAGGTADDQKASSTGLALGVEFGAWEVELTQGLAAKTEKGDDKIESKSMTKLGVAYDLDETMKVYANYGMVKADETVAGTSSTIVDITRYSVGFVNTVVKNDDVNFFYGVALASETQKDVSETTALPVWMGIEANATSWMVFRASVAQNVVLNETKDKSAANVGKSDLDSIDFAAGAGIKLGKGMLDVTFGTGVDKGQVDYATAGFLANAAYTYNF